MLSAWGLVSNKTEILPRDWNISQISPTKFIKAYVARNKNNAFREIIP